ncbi:MAG: tyrosine--tRNA ligase [Candidatus Jacksonbacteria bacterium RIFOXYC2_FULL_44_29]|nr:MAG: tyrosine--tRNA ligase [Candidatus Jacksonbacteria bacterium RIFOXYB2_FULL_44_15]OGY76370.1 MAG: tyrosine--tRNA ligase [Candidatus Jacksonbacteria bacterium RIFOXYA2_FULL_43_12]OGY78008.1 MAG: tyrosine--tRNA ligase [Candidatus Jacksonbacteria bacterium RIFOXYC2_FULL_44_29]OGY80320.1 MAG: tyrosine--tRNA ligase [Candidatus Jacksonbacteria bacterium RIFOXYD2_FULL_43_21]
MSPTKEQLYELLTRGVEKIIVKEHLEKRLLAGDKMRLKLGIDPTGSDIHIGHMVVLRKLRAFQELGHQVIIIVGDYTARIGDPSGRDKMREPLTREQVYENLETYQKQIGKVLNLDKTQFSYQSEWFDKVNLTDILEWAGIFTVQQMIERDMYKKRIADGHPIGIHEFMYPLMQGYDSVAINADVEFGGSDQEFNLLIGRTMQEHFKQPPQNILTTSLLVGTDGRKMSKTYNNYIGVLDKPEEMFGKVMSAIDDIIIEYFKLTTDVPLDEIADLERDLKAGLINPRDAKARLAKEIVKIYHGEIAAVAAAAEFDRIFKNREKPSEMAEFKAVKNDYLLPDLMIAAGLSKSKADAKRVIEQGGVKIDDQIVKDWEKEITIKAGMILQVGKRKFVKIGK